MNIIINGKSIPMQEALKCYKHKKQCKKQFGLNTSEYNYLISEMLNIVKSKKSEPHVSVPSHQLKVQSYET